MNDLDRAAYNDWVSKGMPAGRIPGTQAIMTDRYSLVPVENPDGSIELKPARCIDSFPFIPLFGPDTRRPWRKKWDRFCASLEDYWDAAMEWMKGKKG